MSNFCSEYFLELTILETDDSLSPLSATKKTYFFLLLLLKIYCLKLYTSFNNLGFDGDICKLANNFFLTLCPPLLHSILNCVILLCYIKLTKYIYLTNYLFFQWFSPNRPTGPIRSSSRDVRLSVCLFVCPLPMRFF